MPEQARHISNILQDVYCCQRGDLRQLHLHEKRIKLVKRSEKSTLCICWALVLMKHKAVNSIFLLNVHVYMKLENNASE